MYVIQMIINGIMLGGIYAVLGVGMTMIFGIVKLTNLAHGEFVILGAYGSTLLAMALGVDPLLTLIITVPCMFFIGMGLQTGLINRVMLKGSEPALLVTFGLSIILQDAMLLLFTADARHSGAVYSNIILRIEAKSFMIAVLLISLICTIAALVVKSIYRKEKRKAADEENASKKVKRLNLLFYSLVVIAVLTLAILFWIFIYGYQQESGTIKIDDLNISLLDIILLVISLLTILALTMFLNKTYLGRSIRATSDDTQAASLMGVSVKKTYAIAMGIALATAAIAGLCIGLKWTYYASSGGSYLLIAFGVVVIGGMGSIPGTLVAGFIFGLAQVIGGANYGLLVSYILLIIMLAVRPQGLFSK